MKYRIRVSSEAEKILDRLDRPTERASARGSIYFATIASIPRLWVPLTERAGVRKSRVGGGRILFTVDRDAMVGRKSMGGSFALTDRHRGRANQPIARAGL